jgi:hypothetical protein
MTTLTANQRGSRGFAVSSAGSSLSVRARVSMSMSMPMCSLRMRCIFRRLHEGKLSQEASGIAISMR